MKIVKQISVFVENKKGHLYGITDILGDNGIDIKILSIADTTDFGILRMIVDQTEKAVKLLKDDGRTVKVTDVAAVMIDDSPGGISKVIKTLSDYEIEIEYLYAFRLREEGKSCAIFKVPEAEKAVTALEKANIKLMGIEEICE